MTIRIVHISDTHFGGEQADAVEAATRAAADFDPALIAVTGDITLNGRPREFRAARAWLDRLTRPTLVTPGNHDTPYWNLILRALTPFDRYRRHIGEPGASAVDAPGLAARSLNSARGAQPRLDWSKGAMAVGRVRAIDWGAAPALKLFACHHPLVDVPGEPVTGRVRRGAEAATILAEAGVELILTGHVHVPFVVPLASAPGCYAVSAGTLSRRTRGAPASFSAIVAEDDAFEVTVMAWTGERFEPDQRWRLERRRARR